MIRRSLLVSGIGKRNATLRLLRRACADLDLDLVGCDATAVPPGRADVDRFRSLPRADDPGFAPAYLEAIKSEGAIGFMTLIDPEIPLLGDLESAAALEGARLIHPGAETARMCEDKLAFARVLESSGVPVVATYEEPPPTVPFIRKDRYGSAASGFLRIDRPEDLPIGEGDPSAIFQPYCFGQHYCVDAYFSMVSGELVDLCAKAVLDKRAGESFVLRSASAGRFVEIVQAVARTLPLRGIVNLDVYDEDGELRLMEVNCRIGGNFPASLAFGVDLVHPLIEELAGRPAARRDPWPSSVVEDRVVGKFFDFTDPFDPTVTGGSS